jgi:putative colanic acid biosynthesis glycosyltransferase
VQNEKIKFSIITIVYNGRNCIKKTIESVVNQSYTNYEYLIIDGSSKDDTLKICEEHKCNITKIISEPDKGLYDAMNKGIDNANGDYIIFMNCDDTFYDELVLEKVALAIEANKHPDFIYGDAIEVSEDESQQFLKKARSHKYIWYGMFTHHQAMFYKLDIIKKNNLKYDLQYKIAADYAFTAKYLKYCQSFLYLNFVFCGFKQGGISNINAKDSLDELIKIKKEILNYTKLGLQIFRIYHKILYILRYKFFIIYKYLRYKR